MPCMKQVDHSPAVDGPVDSVDGSEHVERLRSQGTGRGVASAASSVVSSTVGAMALSSIVLSSIVFSTVSLMLQRERKDERADGRPRRRGTIQPDRWVQAPRQGLFLGGGIRPTGRTEVLALEARISGNWGSKQGKCPPR